MERAIETKREEDKKPGSEGARPVDKEDMDTKGHGDELKEAVDQVVEKGPRPEEVKQQAR